MKNLFCHRQFLPSNASGADPLVGQALPGMVLPRADVSGNDAAQQAPMCEHQVLRRQRACGQRTGGTARFQTRSSSMRKAASSTGVSASWRKPRSHNGSPPLRHGQTASGDRRLLETDLPHAFLLAICMAGGHGISSALLSAGFGSPSPLCVKGFLTVNGHWLSDQHASHGSVCECMVAWRRWDDAAFLAERALELMVDQYHAGEAPAPTPAEFAVARRLRGIASALMLHVARKLRLTLAASRVI